MTVRLLAVDLDGTLLDSKWNLSEVNRTALRRAFDLGVAIAFVTGRRYHITKPVTERFDFPHYVITTAGAVTRSHSGEVLLAHPVDVRLAKALLIHLCDFRSYTFLISDVNGREDLWCEKPLLSNVHVARYVELNTDFLIRVPDLSEAVTPATIEVVLLGHIAEMRAASKTMDAFPRSRELKVLRTEYLYRDLCLLDIVDGRTDKGLALNRLAERLGIARSEVMAIGDNHSDIEMLRYAGTAVAMGNATDELKSYGWHVTASNDLDGVARALERFVFPA